MIKENDYPKSDVSQKTGHVGAIALGILLVITFAFELALPHAVFLLLLGTATSMVAWDLVIEKVHRRASTGLDFSLARGAGELRSIVLIKLIGLFATWVAIGLAYFVIKSYSSSQFNVYFALIQLVLPTLIILAPAYLWWTSRHMVDPRDGLWHFGRLVCLKRDQVDKAKVADHLRAWAIKGFFLAFMASIFPDIVYGVINFDLSTVFVEPEASAIFLLRLLFLIDVCFGTIGYILTLRPLDSHIRSANPFLAGWLAAFACYPPFLLMGNGGPLDYRSGGEEWTVWFAGMDGLLIVWGMFIVALTFIYAWATVIFGIRFSNLTHRGIITNGPYRYVRHPAYLSKNVFWWLVHLPFLSTVDSTTALQNCALLLIVNGIYYFRAKTEELHLMDDARYRDYSAWIAKHGLMPRLFALIPRRLFAVLHRPSLTSSR
jgi:protein-S-isoprenylcysteine O-methyltransferase Ste14